MAKMVVLRENLPIRCEICHKADQFNAKTNTCRRCAKVAKRLKDLSWRQANHPNDASVLQVFGALLLFGVHIYFLPYARIFMQDFWLTCGIYFSSLVVGVILIFCGKSRSVI